VAFTVWRPLCENHWTEYQIKQVADYSYEFNKGEGVIRAKNSKFDLNLNLYKTHVRC